MREDIARLSEGVHVVVGTPGRVYDMINRRALSKYAIFIKCQSKETGSSQKHRNDYRVFVGRQVEVE